MAFFLNDTIAYCVDKRDIKEGASSVVPVAELCGSESPNVSGEIFFGIILVCVLLSFE